jgi:hypothetical protein
VNEEQFACLLDKFVHLGHVSKCSNKALGKPLSTFGGIRPKYDCDENYLSDILSGFTQ